MTIKASEHRQLLQLSQIGGLSPCSCHFRCDDYDDDDGLRRQVVGRQGWLVVVVVVVAVAGTTTTAAAVVLASAPSPAPATARNRRRSGSGGA